MTHARITLVDGTTIDDAFDLAERPAALHYRREGRLYGTRDDVVPVALVRQIEYIDDGDETPQADRDHHRRPPRPGDIQPLDVHPKR
jgi:hypothetical protein